MEYTKPVVIAQNNSGQCFAAGCPANCGGTGFPSLAQCQQCDRAQ